MTSRPRRARRWNNLVEVQEDKNEKSARLRVTEADFRDVGRGWARIPKRVMTLLGVKDGDVIEIIGKNRTTAMVFPLSPSEEFQDVIRIDGNTRRNAQAQLDDHVVVRKARVEPALRIVLEPITKYVLRGASTFFKRQLRDRPISLGDRIRLESLGRVIEYEVAEIEPEKDTLLVTSDTEIIVNAKGSIKSRFRRKDKEDERKKIPRVSYEDIGGLDEAVQRVREMVELPMRFPQLFARLGIEPPKGVLMYGPPGTGKTMLAKAVASETNAHFIHISGPELLSKYFGESEERIRKVFEEAKKNAPSIIFIDEIDSIAPKRDDSSEEVEKRIVAQLLSLMDGLESRGDVIVIGATNRPNAVDPALRRPGRFDREVEIGVPNKKARYEILSIHTRKVPLAEDVDLEKLAEITHGFVGADLASLVKEAAMRAVRRILPQLDFSENQVPPEILQELRVTMADFMEAFAEITPSALREVYIELSEVSWDDIGGLDDIKEQLIQAVEWPLFYPELYKYAKMKPPRGILLHGPPGTGKTLLVKALASHCKVNFINIKGSNIISKWVGESEKAISETFRKAKQASPCIIFFDEIDSLLGASSSLGTTSDLGSRIISTFLTELDGIEDLDGVIVIGATNKINKIDPAMLRPGRFDLIIEIPIPDTATRKVIFELYLSKMPTKGEFDWDLILELTEGFTGADISAVTQQTMNRLLTQYVKELHKKQKQIPTGKDLEDLLERYGPSIINEELLFTIKEYRKRFR